MSISFEEFVSAVSAQPSVQEKGPGLVFDRVTVLGGGHDAMLLAALCIAEGTEVSLFSAYGAELDSLRNGHGVSLAGAGPIGSYHVDRDDGPSIMTTAELDRAVANAQVIFLTGPVHKQRTYAMVLADHLQDGQVLVLAPGRSFGAAEAAWLLRSGGARADLTLVEVQSMPYWYSAAGNRFTLSPAGRAVAATIPANRTNVLEALKRFFPNLDPSANAIQSSFHDGSGLVEVPALMLRGPAIASARPNLPTGAVPLPENSTFRALFGPEQESFMRILAEERRKVGRSFGVRELPDSKSWLEIHAGKPKGEGSRPAPATAEAQSMLRCAVVGSLVPLVSAARIAGQSVPVTEGMVTVAGALLGADLSYAGRRLETIGVDVDNIDDCRRLLDHIVRGRR